MKYLFPGYGVRLGGDLNELDRHTTATRSGAMLFVDDLKSAWQYKQRHPNVRVAHRWEKLEADIPLKVMPGQWLKDRLKDFDDLGIPHDAIIIHDTNEPTLTPALIQWEIDYAKAILADPTKPVALMLGFGVGLPDHQRIPELHVLLALMVANPDRLILNLHEYAPIVWTGGVNGSAPPGFNARNKRTDALEYPIPRDKWFTEIFNNACWFMGRFRFWLEYCHQQFKALPNIWISESGFDDVKDVDWWQQNQQRHTDAQGNPIRIAGWKTCDLVWKQFWPQWTDQECLWEQTDRYVEVVYESNFVAADGAVYASPIIAITLFGWSPMGWGNYDYSLASTFKKLYEAFVAGMPIVPTLTVSKPVDARSPKVCQVQFTAPYHNLRSGPGTEYPDAGDVKSGDIIIVYEPERINTKNNSRWVWVETPNGNGWFCKDNVTLVEQTTQPIEQPVTTPVQEQPAPVNAPAAPAPVDTPAQQPSVFKTYSYNMNIRIVADSEEAADTLAKSLAKTCSLHYQQLRYDAAVLAALPHLQTADVQVAFEDSVPGGNQS